MKVSKDTDFYIGFKTINLPYLSIKMLVQKYKIMDFMRFFIQNYSFLGKTVATCNTGSATIPQIKRKPWVTKCFEKKID
jgi:hypothetical protein